MVESHFAKLTYFCVFRRRFCLRLRHELVDVRGRLTPLPQRRNDQHDHKRLLDDDGAEAQLHLEGAQLRAEEGLRRQLLLQLEVIRRRRKK